MSSAENVIPCIRETTLPLPLRLVSTCQSSPSQEPDHQSTSSTVFPWSSCSGKCRRATCAHRHSAWRNIVIGTCYTHNPYSVNLAIRSTLVSVKRGRSIPRKQNPPTGAVALLVHQREFCPGWFPTKLSLCEWISLSFIPLLGILTSVTETN